MCGFCDVVGGLRIYRIYSRALELCTPIIARDNVRISRVGYEGIFDNEFIGIPPPNSLTIVSIEICLNKGIVIKYNANQSYTSDSLSASIFIKILKDKDIPGNPEIDDDPQSLGQETIILRVNDNWEMIHKLEVD